jgi:hypothetical protein
VSEADVAPPLIKDAGPLYCAHDCGPLNIEGVPVGVVERAVLLTLVVLFLLAVGAVFRATRSRRR